MISIITSLYKSDKYLDSFSRHVRSFAEYLNKANLAFEIIAIANDPTEREKQFGKEFSGESWFSFTGVGRESVYATFNRGVSLAKGDILGLWNVDDIRFPESLVEAQTLFSQGAELVHFPFLIKRYLNIGSFSIPLPSQRIDREIPEYSQTTKHQFVEGMVCGPFFLFTKSLYNQVGPFDEQFKISGDFDWCTRAANKTDKFFKAKSLGGIFRVDGGGLSSGVNPTRTAENNIVYMRNHTWKKMKLAEDVIIKQYRPHHLLKGGAFVKI